MNGKLAVLLVDKAFKGESKFKKQIYVAKIAKERIFEFALFKNVQLSSQINESVGGASGHPGQHVPLLVGQKYKQAINMVGQVALDIKKDIVIRRGIVPMKVKENFYSTTY